MACCDIAIASEAASFSLSEVKLGLIPAVISPYVVAAMGPGAARRFILTAERFFRPAGPHSRLWSTRWCRPSAWRRRPSNFSGTWPRAGRWLKPTAKKLVLSLAGRPIDGGLVEETAQRIARIRVCEEAREGLAAFLEKRKAEWQPE